MDRLLMNRVLVVIVNYYTEQDVYDQVMPFRDTGIHFMIVDNGSRRKATLTALHTLSNASVACAPGNLGYLNGAFFGIKVAVSTGIQPDWVLISNPDIAFTGEFFEKLSRIDGSRFAMVAPRLVSGRTGKDQNPYMLDRPDRKTLERLVQIHRWPFLANLYRLGREIAHELRIPLPKPDVEPGGSIYAPHGACMVLAYAFLKRFHTLRYPAFLFCEELFLAEQARRFNRAVVYRPDLEVFHKEHRTTSIFRSRELVEYHREALVYYLKTYARDWPQE